MKWRELVPFPSPLDDPRSVLAVKGPLSPCVPVPPALQRCTELKALASLAGVFFYEVRHRLIAVEIGKDRINDAPLLLSAPSLTASKRPNRRYCPSKHVCCVFHGFKHLPPIGPLAASPVNDNILYHSLDRPRAPSMAGSDYQPTKRKTAYQKIAIRDRNIRGQSQNSLKITQAVFFLLAKASHKYTIPSRRYHKVLPGSMFLFIRRP